VSATTRIKRLLGYYRWKEKRARAALSRAAVPATVQVDWSRVNIVDKRQCSLEIGENGMIDCQMDFERDGARIRIGERAFIASKTQIVCAESVSIGSDVLISWGVTIVDHNSHSVRFSERSRDQIEWRDGKKDWSTVKIAPVVIHDKAWIGFNAIVLKGVTIGEGAVVGAGSVVTKDVAPWTIVAGNPARTVRELAEDER
jgi:acetyltransferase-like isoleucine patch superfamily enzyme